MPSAIDWSLATQNIDIDLSFKTFLQLFKKNNQKREKREKQTMGYKRYNKIYKS